VMVWTMLTGKMDGEVAGALQEPKAV